MTADALEIFAEEARRYCEWARAEHCDPNDPAGRAMERLAALLLAGIRMPHPPADVEEGEELAWTEAPALRRQMAGVPFQYYAVVLDPFALDVLSSKGIGTRCTPTARHTPSTRSPSHGRRLRRVAAVWLRSRRQNAGESRRFVEALPA